MTYQLTPEQQRIVDEANRLSAQADESGHVPSSYFLDKCNSEAGVEYNPVKVVVQSPPQKTLSDVLVINYKMNNAKAVTRASKSAGLAQFAWSLKSLFLHR